MGAPPVTCLAGPRWGVGRAGGALPSLATATLPRRAAVAMSEVEETLKRINSHKGVQGIVIINSDGVPIRSTLEQTLSTNYAAHIMR